MALNCLNSSDVRLSRHGIPLICPVRNEMRFLPAFLRHYRKMGISKFIFIDNNSNDGTTDYLLAQPDCLVFHTSDSYRESYFATLWINELICKLDLQGWMIYVDIDEHLVYPNFEDVDIFGYCESVGRAGFDCVNAAMIDMYPSGSFIGLSFEPEEELSSVMGWFDTDYILREAPKRPWDKRESFMLQVVGGPRCRLLSSLAVEERHGAIFQTICNQLDRIIDRVPFSFIPLLAKIAPREIPAQHKQPINFAKPGFRYLHSHQAINRSVGPDMTALLHYKFCGELTRRFEMKSEGNHFRRGLQYLQLENAVSAWGKPSLVYEGSRQYKSSADLAVVGLIGPAAGEVWKNPKVRAIKTSASGPRVARR
jgi:hypothetical protein